MPVVNSHVALARRAPVYRVRAMQTPARMLVVDDEPLIGMMMEDFLDAMGVEEVVVVQDVEGALSQITAGRFDAAILDVNLAGGVRSDAVAERLAMMGVPFAVASGDPLAPPGWGERPLLSKPYTLTDLERVVDRL